MHPLGGLVHRRDMNANGKKLLSIRGFCDDAGIGRTKAYALLKSGDLAAIKVGRNTKIFVEERDRYLASLPAYSPRK